MNKKKAGIILITAALITATAATIVVLCSASRPKAEHSSSTTVSSHGVSVASIEVPSASSEVSSSAAKSSTAITVDVTQSKAGYTASKPNTTKAPDVSVAASSTSRVSSSSASNQTSSKASSSSGNSQTGTKTSSTASSSKPQIPNVPASQEIVTKTIGSNTMRLNVNAFTFEAFVDWSDFQNYLFDDFYVKVYKNGVLKSGPDLYGCVTKDPTNTVAVEIDTYQSNGHWYIQPATYKIECYSKLSEHSLVKDNRPQIIPCPSATFTVSINERGFQ